MKRYSFIGVLTAFFACVPSLANAVMTLSYGSLSVAGGPGVVNSITVSNASGAVVTNYPFQFGRPFVQGTIPHAPQVLIDGAPATTQADVKNRYPDGSVEFAVIAVVLPSLPVVTPVTLTFRDDTTAQAPLSLAQMDAMLPVGKATMTLTPGGTVDARTMLDAGFCKPFTQGQVEQIMQCADDAPTRTYDMSPNQDAYRPFRPRFNLAFWPGIGVAVQAIGENANSQEQEDLSYKVAVSDGYSADLTGTQATNPKMHWAETDWSHRFWAVGTAPSTQVNIDNNLAYLASTRFLPNFDTSITVSQTNLATEYSRYSQNANDIYDGYWNQPTDSTTWQSTMATTGARQDIAPYPEWTALWLYTGDWRMRQVALGLADQVMSWPIHLREGDPTKRFLLTDPIPAAGQTGAGYGKVLSHLARPSGYVARFFCNQGWASPADCLPVLPAPATVGKGNPWTADGAHQASMTYPQYILTGDPSYLDEMTFWAGWSAFDCWGGSGTVGQGCGPYPSTQVYGGAIHDQLRGDAWILRNRAETAFAEPDGTSEKTYFTALTDEAIARWEGGFQLTGTKFDGTPMKVWGQKVGNEGTTNAGAYSGQIPPLHEWSSICDPALAYTACVNDPPWLTTTTGGFSDPWMQWYVQYAIGRAAELGFPMQAINAFSAQFPVGMILDSGMPVLVANYEDGPLGSGTTGWLTTWPSWMTSLNLAPNCCGQTTGGFPAYFTNNLNSDGRPVWLTPGLAMAVDQGQPRASDAWLWFKTNVYAKVPDFGNDPKWAIVPRTDGNVLPSIQ